MILKRLAVNRLPGIRQPFEIEVEGPGVHVVFGPNGVGKSSIGRAVQRLYWDNRGSGRKTSLSGVFEWNGQTWRAEREGPNLRWSRGDEVNLSPNLPPSHTYRCFFLSLRDLVDPSLESTADMASEIRRQMSGGFDLDRIASSLFSPVSPPRKRQGRKAYNEASDQVDREALRQAGLQQRVDQLEQRKSQLKEADAAASRLAHVERAIGLAGRREQLVRIRAEIAKLPSALASLTGQERDAVDKEQQQLARLVKLARDLESELQGAREDRKKSKLDRPLEEVDLATWRDKADELGRTEQTLEAARTERETAKRKLASASDAVGAEKTDHAQLSLPNQSQLFEFLRASHAHATRVGEIRERLAVLESADAPRHGEPRHGAPRVDEHDTERIGSAADVLRSWLRVPQSKSLSIRFRSRWPWLLLAFAVIVAGGALAFLMDPLLALIAIVGPGIGLAAWFPGGERGADLRRQDLQARYQDLGAEEPAQWDLASVSSTLRRLESARAEREASRTRARDRDVERKPLEKKLERLAEEEKALEVRRQDLKAVLRLESLPPDAELVDFARALDHLRVARGDYEAMAGKVQREESRHSSLLAQLTEILEQYGEAPPADAAEAKARIHNLADRNSRLKKALSTEQRIEGDLKRNASDRESTRASINRIYAAAGLDSGNATGLASLVEQLPYYRELIRSESKLGSQVELDRSELEKGGESELSRQNSQSLEQLKIELSKAGSQASRLREEIAGINARVEQIKAGADMQNLIAVREESRADLQQIRDAALFAEAGEFLIQEIEQEYAQTSTPRLFERAQEHFSGFTLHNYELRLEKGKESPRLFAVESRSKQRREIDELSDGTRAQLLLAARMAFAEEVEQGKVLPLFLDEALDQSDPQRFDAVARSLGRIAHEQGRQIFYFTSDPLDVDRIRHALSRDGHEPARPVDLARIRTRAESVGGPEALRVSLAPDLPAPDGLTPEEYGALLRVPALHPALGFAEQHVFYLLWDHLALVRDLLTCAVEWAGQWRTVAGTSLEERLASRSAAVTEMGDRLNLLEVFCELWKQGRGKPVERDALVDSGALSGRYLDDVVEVARELDGDAERLLEALASRKDPRLKGFRSSNVDDLQNYLAEQEYLDDRPVLSESELRLRCMASPAANHLSAAVAAECVRRWCEWAQPSSSEAPQAGQN